MKNGNGLQPTNVLVRSDVAEIMGSVGLGMRGQLSETAMCKCSCCSKVCTDLPNPRELYTLVALVVLTLSWQVLLSRTHPGCPQSSRQPRKGLFLPVVCLNEVAKSRSVGCLTRVNIQLCQEKSELGLYCFLHMCGTVITMCLHWLAMASGFLLFKALFSVLQGYHRFVPSLGLRVPGTDGLSLAATSSMSPFSLQEALPPSRPASQGSARGSQLPSCR